MSILILGGGICGLGAALLLARDGHDVTVVEHDSEPVPASPHDAWERWERKGVAQFRQPHNFMPGLRLLLEAELPDVQHALGRAGACRLDLANPLPSVFADRAPRPVDEKLWTLSTRRPVGEWVFADAAQREPRVTVRRGVTIVMSGIADRYRRFVVGGVPIVTGFVAVADAWACTNPSAGRGLTVGLLHALRLRDSVRAHGDNPQALVEDFDRRTDAEITPWYHAQIAFDRTRFSEMEALRNGRDVTAPDDVLAQRIAALMSLLAADPDLFRAALEYIATITPVQHILERPDVIQRMAIARETIKDVPRRPIPGPTRDQLLQLVG